LFWLRGGIGANAEPSRLEAAVARRLRSLAIPSSAKEMANPYASDPNAWRMAVNRFQEQCALCHDSDGRGQAVVGRSLYPRAPDMTQPATQNLTDGELFYIGAPRCPPHRHAGVGGAADAGAVVAARLVRAPLAAAHGRGAGAAVGAAAVTVTS
jgi:hypothetical protein